MTLSVAPWALLAIITFMRLDILTWGNLRKNEQQEDRGKSPPSYAHGKIKE